jgi:5-methylcytosine-specific restriction protein A
MTKLKTLPPRLRELGASTPKSGGWLETRTTSRHQRGYGAAWDRLRLVIMRRDAGLCQSCKRAGRMALGKICDHIVGKADWMAAHGNLDGCDAETNLEIICADCNRSKVAQESANARARSQGIEPIHRPARVRGCDDSGVPLDPAHHWRRG